MRVRPKQAVLRTASRYCTAVRITVCCHAGFDTCARTRNPLPHVHPKPCGKDRLGWAVGGSQTISDEHVVLAFDELVDLCLDAPLGGLHEEGLQPLHQLGVALHVGHRLELVELVHLPVGEVVVEVLERLVDIRRIA